MRYSEIGGFHSVEVVGIPGFHCIKGAMTLEVSICVRKYSS